LCDHLPGSTFEQLEHTSLYTGSLDGEASLKSALKWSQKAALGQLNKHSSMQAQMMIQHKYNARGAVALSKEN